MVASAHRRETAEPIVRESDEALDEALDELARRVREHEQDQ